MTSDLDSEIKKRIDERVDERINELIQSRKLTRRKALASAATLAGFGAAGYHWIGQAQASDAVGQIGTPADRPEVFCYYVDTPVIQTDSEILLRDGNGTDRGLFDVSSGDLEIEGTLTENATL